MHQALGSISFRPEARALWTILFMTGQNSKMQLFNCSLVEYKLQRHIRVSREKLVHSLLQAELRLVYRADLTARFEKERNTKR